LLEVNQIEGWILVFILTLVLGLSVDYEVFLVTRMREAWEKTALEQRRRRARAGPYRPVVTAAGLHLRRRQREHESFLRPPRRLRHLDDKPHLSIPTGTDAGSGCGSLINGVVGAGGDADAGAFVDYPSTDGMPLSLDASRTITPALSTSRASSARRRPA
jgi:hypothetical protein